jgi:hypothetical protein
MAFYTAWTEKLQSVRTRLEENTMINDPLNYSKLTGTLDFLLNPSLNPRTIDVIQNQNSAAGQYRSVEIRYQPHWGDEDTVTTDASASCTSNNQRRDTIGSYDVDLFVHTKFTLDEDYIRQNSEDGDSQQSRLERGFRSAMRLNRESMNSQLLAKAAANMGSNPAAGAAAGVYTTVQVIDSNSGVDVGTFDTFKNQQEDNFMGGPISMVGLGNARKYFNRLAVGNVNTNAGVDIVEIANQFGGLLFKDQFASSALGGANRILALYPGLTQFYGYNLYNGVFAKETPDSLIKGTMPDSIYNFSWDYKIRYDDQCDSGNGLQGAWVVEVFKYFDLFTTPAGAFGGSYSELAEFNGIVGYDLTSA